MYYVYMFNAFRDHLSRLNRPVAGYRLFFPLAAAYAATVPALSLAAMRGGMPWLPGLATPPGHAHELLFGFGLAVVAGFLLNRVARWRLHALLGLWLAGRIGALAWPESAAGALANIAFALYLARLTAPPLLAAAKKWRNKALAPVLIALALAVIAFHAAGAAGLHGLRYPVLHTAVLLFATLMLFMGGRILAPAVAGHAQRRGHLLEARVQPRLEGTLLVLMGAALVAGPAPLLRVPFALCLLAAAVFTAVRLGRWRLWWCRDRPDLLCLSAGYAWLAAGLGLWGAAALTGTPRPGTAIHAITIGAMGTLTVSVMARTWLLKGHFAPASTGGPVAAVAAIAIAACLRVAGPGHMMALLASAVFWGLAYGLLLAFFLRHRSGAGHRRQQPREQGQRDARGDHRPAGRVDRHELESPSGVPEQMPQAVAQVVKQQVRPDEQRDPPGP